MTGPLHRSIRKVSTLPVQFREGLDRDRAALKPSQSMPAGNGLAVGSCRGRNRSSLSGEGDGAHCPLDPVVSAGIGPASFSLARVSGLQGHRAGSAETVSSCPPRTRVFVVG